MRKQDISFCVDGTTLRGWYFRPDGIGPWPGILLSHGFSALKEMSLERYAQVFCDAGLACVVYDHRNLGESDGEPRGEIDPWRQVLDMRHAISFLRRCEGVQPDRIGIWGASYAGGHVIVVASQDRRVKCVVSQAMTIDGGEAARRRSTPEALATLRQRANADLDRRSAGDAPARVPVCEPGSDSYRYLIESFPEAGHPNDITLLSRDLALGYKPGAYIEEVAPTPLLMVLAGADTLTPVNMQREAFARAREPKQLVVLDGATHYQPYIERFAESSSAARDWFLQHL